MFGSKEEFKEHFMRRFEQQTEEQSPQTAYAVLGDMLREHIQEDWERTNTRYAEHKDKQLYYFSIEFLIGRLLGQNLLNLACYDLVKEGLDELGYDLSEIEEFEPEPGLGNGGLGRLAAGFLDSLASLQMPGHGCGIRYKGGLFTQHIKDGFQTEQPTDWIRETGSLDVRREDLALDIPFFGQAGTAENAEWVKAVPYDMPVVGANGRTINTLRLWQAEPSDRPIPSTKTMQIYERETAAISDRLYPDDSLDEGKILRLKQQYFLCSASIRTILKERQFEIRELPDRVAIQVNDTHPAMAVPELMRVLLDEEGLDWDEAWAITTRTISYTNHTILEEAMEKWDSYLIETLLPRIYQIIEEIDRRFKAKLATQQLSTHDRHKLSIIENDRVKMAVLAVVGSYKVNGVAKLHTEILKQREMKELHEQFPDKFHNKTNGISHRRWLMKANPELASLITESIGSGWVTEPERLRELDRFAKDQSFHASFEAVKRQKKEQLIRHVEHISDSPIDPDSIFDIHIKRIHGYKRQLMNILHIQMLYDRIRQDSSFRPYPRTFFFGGKAAPTYDFAKQVIKTINTVAHKVNSDPLVRQHVHVVFVENYNVSKAEQLIPAANVSEQISTASKEASGTGNMKFMMNGALTLGTVDGANVEIFEQVGEENAFPFGLLAEQVMQFEKDGTYDPQEIIRHDPEIRQVMAELTGGQLTDGIENSNYIIRQLIDRRDPFFVLKDLRSYMAVHDQMLMAYTEQTRWTEMAIKNVAASGYFSSDRTIRQYAEEVWHLDRRS
ncbi:glycogen/starch/alpha-glucan phosphorylase [Planococcus lenghuensis]|uniref:Alpha-1,4 glucan phosphorylase n=1 Tax=Planococcus lenghuensis TaxID=2213202 RepID=A0A1Q2KVE7_9BACL|nr:glycogen/starch/alpha-glucan phosphorylase [Planococcus lenghuensis]AQQ52171.1 glycogen phosphorylase [Planococcus lenghuensis]